MIVKGDAFALPFADDAFQVVVADPPYMGKNRGKKGVGYASVEYIPFKGRQWWHEAWRVLDPSGHLYVFCAVREIREWFGEVAHPLADIIAWVAPNNPSLSAYWRRGTGGRAPTWRPVLHWQKPPAKLIEWSPTSQAVNAFTGKQLRGDQPFVDPNVFITAAIQSNMREAQPWPNQLPVALLRWLLRPHAGTGMLLDLFTGTGTTRTAAVGLGMPVVSVDLSMDACRLTMNRPAQTHLMSMGGV